MDTHVAFPRTWCTFQKHCMVYCGDDTCDCDAHPDHPDNPMLELSMSLNNLKEPTMKYAIAAMARNRVIGIDNKMPWHLPDDFKWFKSKTMGHTLVMGRKTYESIGRPLPGRDTIVLTRSDVTFEGVRMCKSLEELDTMDINGDIYFCGGADIYKQTLPMCSDLFLTHVKQDPEGDAYFPDIWQDYKTVSTIIDCPEFTVVHYRNIHKPSDEDVEPGASG